MLLIFNLPGDLFRSVLLWWLRLVHIGRLDSAICNSVERYLFINLIRGSDFVLSHVPFGRQGSPDDVTRGEHFTGWLFTRDVAVTDICITAWFATNHRERLTYLQHNGQAIRTVLLVRTEYTPFPTAVPAELGTHCPNISCILEFRRSRFGIVRAIAVKCPQLQEIFVFDGLSESTLIALGNACKRLVAVKLFQTNVTDAGLLAIARNGALHELGFSAGCHVTNVGVQAAVACCPLLEMINLRNSTQFTTATFVALGKHCYNLRKLDMFGIVIARTSSSAIVVDWPLLESISAEHGKGTAPVIAAAARGSPRLRDLNMGVGDMSTEAALALAEFCPLLQDVMFSRCTAIGDEEITALVRGCPALRNLYVEGTSVTAVGLHAIRDHCRSLKHITLNKNVYSGAAHNGRLFPVYVKVSVAGL
jgi:hypothetical protein